MAPIQPQPSQLFACDIVRFSDAELDQYLEANGRLVEVEDPENLPEDFIQRLRVRADASDTQSRPIDLGELTTRLEQIPVGREAPPRSPSLASTEDLGEEEYYRRDLANETEYYNTLIREGGRPSHPVSLSHDILEDPGEYREILSYWQLESHEPRMKAWKVFASQMGEWQRFLEYQRKNRQEGRFPIYINALKRSFARHKFTRPYQLDEDPERQDKLTTWIEFLDYEYWIYDQYIATVKLRQPMYDEAWKELVDSQVLRAHETEEFICNIDSAFQRAGERERAKKAVESAQSAVMSARNPISDPRRSNPSQRDPRQRLAAAQSRLDSAVKSLETIKRRNGLVSEFHGKTRNYQIAKEKADHRSILLRWILQQIPLIELELSPAEVAENNADGGNGGKRRSKRNRAEESSEERVSKRQKHDGESNSISRRRTRAPTAKERESLLKRSRHGPLNEGRVSKRPGRDGQKPRLSLHDTSDAAGLTPIGEHISVQTSATQDSGATAARSTKARSLRRSAPKKTRLEAKTLAKGVLDGKARVMKTGRGGRNSRNLSALDSSPRRRSARMRKLPDRFY